MSPVLIWSGEWRAYWRPESKGYTENRSEAGRYPREEAEAILRSVGPEKKLKIQPIPEKPLLFKGEMVRAILSNRKTMTRRLVTDILGIGRVTEFQRSNTPGYDWTFRDKRMLWNDLRHADMLKRCPYGQVGDLLWGRESFNWSEDDDLVFGENYKHCPERDIYRAKNVVWAADGMRCHPEGGKCLWLPSIHMPRFASRILLEIANVRLEPLQEITEDEAVAEGAWFRFCGKNLPGWSMLDPHPTEHARCLGSARFAFANYINELHGGPKWNLKPSNLWDENPWVWAITFKRVEAN